MKTVVLLLLTLTLLSACGTARRSVPLAGPLDLQTPELAAGQNVFLSSCHQCHPGGEAGLGTALNNKPLPGPLIRLQIRQGLGAMPAFSKEEISDADLDHLIDYLKVLRQNTAE